jgi:hypothetical protein
LAGDRAEISTALGVNHFNSSRIYDTGGYLLSIMQHTLFFGAIITTLLAILIASILFVMMELAHPFASGIAIQPEGYINVLEIMANK